jgi:hypothetical protein
VCSFRGHEGACGLGESGPVWDGEKWKGNNTLLKRGFMWIVSMFDYKMRGAGGTWVGVGLCLGGDRRLELPRSL